MAETYQRESNFPNVLKELLNWLPAFCWLPFALSINSFIIPPGTALAYWGRWVGLVVLVIYGFFKTVLPGKWQLNNFDLFTLIIFIVITVSTVYADVDSALYVTDFYQTGIFKALSLLLAYLFLTWGVQSLLCFFTDATAIVRNLVLITTFIYLVGLAGNLSGLIPESLGAFSGIFFNPNTTAALGIVILPLSIWFASQQKQWGILRFFPVIVVVAAIGLSEARTPFFVASILFLYYLICWARYRSWEMLSIYGISVILISLLLILSIDFWESDIATKLYESLTDSTKGGISSYRTSLIWPLFIKEIFSSPLSVLIGNGWGSEEALLKLQASQNDIFERLFLGTAHSAYLGLTYQIGVIGCLLAFVPLWSLVLSQIHNSLCSTSTEQFEFRLALVGALLAELCLCFFETGFYNIGSAHALVAWLVTYIAVKTKDLQVFDCNYL